MTFHDAWLVLLAWYAFSAIVSGMPEPDSKASKGYQWLYSSLHVLAGNLVTAAKQHDIARSAPPFVSLTGLATAKPFVFNNTGNDQK